MGPVVVKHTHRLMQPEDESFGDWTTPREAPEALDADRSISVVMMAV